MFLTSPVDLPPVQADQLDDGEEDTEEELEDSILNESTSADPPEKETGDGKDTDVKVFARASPHLLTTTLLDERCWGDRC